MHPPLFVETKEVLNQGNLCTAALRTTMHDLLCLHHKHSHVDMTLKERRELLCCKGDLIATVNSLHYKFFCFIHESARGIFSGFAK
jgi:hypothetical protein